MPTPQKFRFRSANGLRPPKIPLLFCDGLPARKIPFRSAMACHHAQFRNLRGATVFLSILLFEFNQLAMDHTLIATE
jgi:hypothetical protein